MDLGGLSNAQMPHFLKNWIQQVTALTSGEKLLVPCPRGGAPMTLLLEREAGSNAAFKAGAFRLVVFQTDPEAETPTHWP